MAIVVNIMDVIQMQSPVGGDDDMFIDETLLDAEDDVKVECPVPEKVSVPKH